MPASKPETARNPAAPRSIEELRTQYDQLKTKQTVAETHLKLAKEKLEELRTEARQTYGTDDVAKLREKLAEMTRENEQKRADYQAALAKIEANLQQVESDFAAAENSGKSE
jgi:hypothetical protein